MAKNCTSLENFSNYEDYMPVLSNVFPNNITASAMQVCRTQICTALYSTGSPDVSGIGVGAEAVVWTDWLTLLGCRRIFFGIWCCYNPHAGYAMALSPKKRTPFAGVQIDDNRFRGFSYRPHSVRRVGIRDFADQKEFWARRRRVWQFDDPDCLACCDTGHATDSRFLLARSRRQQIRV